MTALRWMTIALVSLGIAGTSRAALASDPYLVQDIAPGSAAAYPHNGCRARRRAHLRRQRGRGPPPDLAE